MDSIGPSHMWEYHWSMKGYPPMPDNSWLEELLEALENINSRPERDSVGKRGQAASLASTVL